MLPPAYRNDLENLNVLSLEAFGAFEHVELDGLAFLQAAESTGLDRAEMHENVLAILAADKPKTLSVVEPLNCYLFHDVLLYLFFSVFCAEKFEALWSGCRGWLSAGPAQNGFQIT